MKGRSKSLIQLRNEHLVKRYYYHYELKRRRIDDVLSTLQYEEVFLEETYILRLLSEHNHLLKQLKHAKVPAHKLSEFRFSYNVPTTQGTLFAQVS